MSRKQIDLFADLFTLYLENNEESFEAVQDLEYLEDGFSFQDEDRYFDEATGELKGILVREGYDSEQEHQVRDLIGFEREDVYGETGVETKWRPVFDIFMDDSSTIDAYYTTTGEVPVTLSEAEQADINFPSHLMAMEVDTSSFDKEEWLVGQPVDYGNMEDWWMYRNYQYHKQARDRFQAFMVAKLQRRSEARKIVRWLIRQDSKSLLLKAYRRFWMRLTESRKACAKSGDWSTVWLTKEQVTYITQLFQLRIKLSK